MQRNLSQMAFSVKYTRPEEGEEGEGEEGGGGVGEGEDVEVVEEQLEREEAEEETEGVEEEGTRRQRVRVGEVGEEVVGGDDGASEVERDVEEVHKVEQRGVGGEGVGLLLPPGGAGGPLMQAALHAGRSVGGKGEGGRGGGGGGGRMEGRGRRRPARPSGSRC